MSKSYGKYKTCGNCGGTNTIFYKLRRRKFRRKNKQALIKALHFNEEFLAFIQPKKDAWNEPTDGVCLWYKKDIDELRKESGKHYGLYSAKNGKVKK